MLIRNLFGRTYREEGDAGSGAGGAATGGTGAGTGAGGTGGTGGTGDQSGNGMSAKERELLHEVMDRKNKQKELEKNLNEAKEQLKKFDGIDPAEVRKLLDERRQAEEKALEAKGEYEKIRTQMVETHKTEKATLQAQIEELSNQIKGRDSAIDDLTVGAAFASSGFIAEKLTLPATKARQIYGSHFERNEKGQVVGYDKPRGAAGRAPLVDGNGEPLSFDAAFQKLIETDPDKERLIRATTNAGAGSGTTNGKVDVSNTNTNLTGKDRIGAGLAAGLLKGGRTLELRR